MAEYVTLTVSICCDKCYTTLEKVTRMDTVIEEYFPQRLIEDLADYNKWSWKGEELLCNECLNLR